MENNNEKEIKEKANKDLISFLRDLANQAENQSLLPSQLKRIGEFYVEYHAREDLENNQDFSKEEFFKFLFLGYYIYRFILDNR